MHLTPQSLICKEGKNDLLEYDGSFLEKPFSTCVKKIASTKNEIELHCSTSMPKHLVQSYNVRISYLDKELLIFDEDTSG